MARYTFNCRKCEYADPDVVLPWKERDSTVVLCPSCKWPMEREFPGADWHGRADTFTPFYDEMLDQNFYSKDEWQAALKERGLIEAGDKEHGARLYDESLPAGSRIERQPPKAGKDTPVERGEPDVDIPLEIVDNEGNVEEVIRLGDLDTPGEPDRKAAEKSLDHLSEFYKSHK